MTDDIKWAIRVTYQTLIGTFGEYPREMGNCFSVETEDGENFAIVNFILENYEEAIQRGVSLPIKIRVLGSRFAVIFDERIPDDWYQDRYCTLCCPENLLLETQQDMHKRQRARRERVSFGKDGSWISIDGSKAPKL